MFVRVPEPPRTEVRIACNSYAPQFSTPVSSNMHLSPHKSHLSEIRTQSWTTLTCITEQVETIHGHAVATTLNDVFSRVFGKHVSYLCVSQSIC
eukprot:m.73738 g.73738  ORF g.73738 m.73738 type:complete len:94 (+) comp16130_c1_seq7:262-543(+)